MTLFEAMQMTAIDGFDRGYEAAMRDKEQPRVTPGFKDGMELSQEAYEEMQTAFRQALRQWKMYAEIEPDRDLATEQSPEAEMYRTALALSAV